MDIAKCEECGYEITLKTDTCPMCGESVNRGGSTFKRLIFRLILILLILYIFLTSVRMFNW